MDVWKEEIGDSWVVGSGCTGLQPLGWENGERLVGARGSFQRYRIRVWSEMLHSVRFGTAQRPRAMNPIDFRGLLDKGR